MPRRRFCRRFTSLRFAERYHKVIELDDIVNRAPTRWPRAARSARTVLGVRVYDSILFARVFYAGSRRALRRIAKRPASTTRPNSSAAIAGSYFTRPRLFVYMTVAHGGKTCRGA